MFLVLFCTSSSAHGCLPSTWIQRHGISRGSEPPHAPSSLWCTALNVRENEQSPTLPFFSASLHVRSVATATEKAHAHWLFQNSKVCNCLQIDTAGRSAPSLESRQEGGERGWEREVAAVRRSSSVLKEKAELVEEYELLWCSYLSPPPSFSL